MNAMIRSQALHESQDGCTELHCSSTCSAQKTCVTSMALIRKTQQTRQPESKGDGAQGLDASSVPTGHCADSTSTPLHASLQDLVT